MVIVVQTKAAQCTKYVFLYRFDRTTFKINNSTTRLAYATRVRERRARANGEVFV